MTVSLTSVMRAIILEWACMTAALTTIGELSFVRAGACIAATTGLTLAVGFAQGYLQRLTYPKCPGCGRRHPPREVAEE